MNWLDSAIGFLSPEWGAKRKAWRQEYEDLRNYDAGNSGRSNTNWRVMNQSGEMTDRGSRDTVRAKARDLERNSDMMNSVTGAYKRNVIGGGYTLQARTADEDLNTRIEDLWKEWCKKENCDITATQSFNQMIRMAVNRKKVDGGILFLKVYTKGGILPFKLQPLEVDELDSAQVTPKKPENKVVGGIEYNEYNRAVGYWIRQYEIDGFSIKSSVYIEAKRVIFYFSKRRPSQLREMSDMAPTVSRIRDVNEFMVAVSVKERIAACLAVFIKKISRGGVGRGGQSDEQASYEGKNITPGMIRELNIGEEAQFLTPGGQATDANGFVKLQERLMAAGQGLSYEAVSRDMSQTNYSSARQGMIEDDLTYEEERELLTEFMAEVYETFLISAVLSGLLPLRDFWENKRAYIEHEWIQEAKRWIDPLKEANAYKIALQTGQKTYSQVCAENGRDWKEQLQQMQEEREYAKSLGLDMDQIIYIQTKKGGSV